MNSEKITALAEALNNRFINESDIVTEWGNPTSNEKVPSEKLVKDSIDSIIAPIRKETKTSTKTLTAPTDTFEEEDYDPETGDPVIRHSYVYGRHTSQGNWEIDIDVNNLGNSMVGVWDDSDNNVLFWKEMDDEDNEYIAVGNFWRDYYYNGDHYALQTNSSENQGDGEFEVIITEPVETEPAENPGEQESPMPMIPCEDVIIKMRYVNEQYNEHTDIEFYEDNELLYSMTLTGAWNDMVVICENAQNDTINSVTVTTIYEYEYYITYNEYVMNANANGDYEDYFNGGDYCVGIRQPYTEIYYNYSFTSDDEPDLSDFPNINNLGFSTFSLDFSPIDEGGFYVNCIYHDGNVYAVMGESVDPNEFNDADEWFEAYISSLTPLGSATDFQIVQRMYKEKMIILLGNEVVTGRIDESIWNNAPFSQYWYGKNPDSVVVREGRKVVPRTLEDLEDYNTFKTDIQKQLDSKADSGHIHSSLNLNMNTIYDANNWTDLTNPSNAITIESNAVSGVSNSSDCKFILNKEFMREDNYELTFKLTVEHQYNSSLLYGFAPTEILFFGNPESTDKTGWYTLQGDARGIYVKKYTSDSNATQLANYNTQPTLQKIWIKSTESTIKIVRKGNQAEVYVNGYRIGNAFNIANAYNTIGFVRNESYSRTRLRDINLITDASTLFYTKSEVDAMIDQLRQELGE